MKPGNGTLDCLNDLVAWSLDSHQETDDVRAFGSRDGRQFVGPSLDRLERLVIVLLAPARPAIVDIDLAVERDADGKIECSPGFSAGFGVSPREMRPAFGDFAKQLHHPDHGVVIVGDGIHVGAAPAAAASLLTEDVVKSALGRPPVKPVFSGLERLGQVADLRVGGDSGRGSVFAIVIMIAVIPIMILNIYRHKQEQKI